MAPYFNHGNVCYVSWIGIFYDIQRAIEQVLTQGAIKAKDRVVIIDDDCCELLSNEPGNFQKC